MPGRVTDPAIDTRWDERIARARQLANEYSPAADILTFYAALAEYQKSLLDTSTGSIQPTSGPPEGGHYRSCEAKSASFFEALDLEPVLGAIPEFVSWLQGTAPSPLIQAVSEMRKLDRVGWRSVVDAYLTQQGGDIDHTDAPSGAPRVPTDHAITFVVEAVLQPFAEQLAIRIANPGSRMAFISARGAPPPLAAAPRLEDSLVAAAAGASRIPNPESRVWCPICGSLPVLGILREEGHGAKRTLLCALCLTEWEYLRVVCTRCGEQQFDALPVYTADQFAHIRIEACDSCRSYLKTIDMTKNGLAVPLVDDLASVALDLWARERGYVRLRSSLLGL